MKRCVWVGALAVLAAGCGRSTLDVDEPPDLDGGARDAGRRDAGPDGGGRECTGDEDCGGPPTFCEGGGRCEARRCVRVPPADCDDGLACSADFCDPDVGCINAPVDADADGHPDAACG